MKTIILTLVLAYTMIPVCNAQKIEMKKVLGSYQFTQNGKKISYSSLVKLMESNSEAHNLMKKSKSNNTIASILGGAGGALIGFPLGTAAGGGNANWTLAGIGAGLVALGSPISSSANRNGKKAVELYNSSLNSSSYYQFKPEFKIIANGNGIGLTLNF